MLIHSLIRKNKFKKGSISLLIALIILIGIFKNYVTRFFNQIIDFSISFFNVSRQEIEESLLFITDDSSMELGLGIIFFYFTYLFMHYLLINFLFIDHLKICNLLIWALLISVIGLAFLTVIFKLSGLTQLGIITFDLFRQLAAKPLILFLVEGGGLIFKNLEQKGIIE